MFYVFPERGESAAVAMMNRSDGAAGTPAVRVVVAFTGGVGSHAIRLVASHPRMELVGVQVHSPEKAGLDAGELAGIEPVGVVTTTDVDALLASEPDCVAWLGRGWQPEVLAYWLRAGVNVYTPIGAWYPHEIPEYSMLDEACGAGNSTLVSGGNIPGLISDVLPLFLSGYVGDVQQIRATQRNLVGDYPSATQLRNGLGFGNPVPEETSGATLTEVDKHWIGYIRQSAQMVADGLGIRLDELTITRKEYVAAPHDFRLGVSGLEIPAGTTAGARWEFTGYSDGRPFYVLEKEQVAVPGLAPGWRRNADDPQWHVEIDGTPSISCDLSTQPGLTGFGSGTAELNAARAVNFLPTLVAADPGCRSVLDLPMITGFTPVRTAVPAR